MISLWLACSTSEKLTETQDSAIASESVLAIAGDSMTGWVGESVSFDGSGSSGTAFEWYFGDGDTSTDLVSSHTFYEAGVYQAVLTAFGSDGSQHTDAISVSIQHPPTEEQAVVSASIVATETDIWVLFPENASLSQLSRSGELIAEWPICEGPQQLAHSDGVIGISCRGDSQLLLFDVASETQDFIALPSRSQPYGVVGKAGEWWLTLSATGELAHYDGQETQLYPLGTDPRGLSLLADGSLMSPRWRATSEGSAIYHFESGTLSQIPLGLDYNGDSDNTTGGTPNLLEHVMPTVDGRTLFVPMLHANTLRGEFLSGQPLTFESTLRAMLAKIELADKAEFPAERKHFDERGRSSAVVSSKTGDKLYVLHPSAGHISILDRNDLEIIGSILNVGVGSNGLALDPSGDQLYVHAWLDRKVRAYRLDDSSHDLLWEAPLSTTEPLSETELLGKQIFHSAADPRITRSQYIACTHCHPDGDQDGQVWDFTDRGEGLRNTTALFGRGDMAMGPLHWTGNFDEFQDFESDMRIHFGGSGFLDDEVYAECAENLGESKSGLNPELDALAAYLATLPLPTSGPVEAVPDSESILYDLGCEACHSPPLYTDSSLETFLRHDVGTLQDSSGMRMGMPLDGIDTPTLLGLWDSAPYLHDGSAPDLERAIRAHTEFSPLSDDDILILINTLHSL